ncbi:hypothetical protein AcV5_007870 [Taiwanofungus camphoratus]|nr:hypothetical protein AcV5_007870 [Antrodia cinnamomea]
MRQCAASADRGAEPPAAYTCGPTHVSQAEGEDARRALELNEEGDTQYEGTFEAANALEDSEDAAWSVSEDARRSGDHMWDGIFLHRAKITEVCDECSRMVEVVLAKTEHGRRAADAGDLGNDVVGV